MVLVKHKYYTQFVRNIISSNVSDHELANFGRKDVNNN